MDQLTIQRCALQITVVSLLLCSAVTTLAQELTTATKKEPSMIWPQKIVEQGIAIEFTVAPQTPNASVPKAAEAASHSDIHWICRPRERIAVAAIAVILQRAHERAG